MPPPRAAARKTLRFIVVGEVAVAVALLVGAALLGRLAALLAFDPGSTRRTCWRCSAAAAAAG